MTNTGENSTNKRVNDKTDNSKIRRSFRFLKVRLIFILARKKFGGEKCVIRIDNLSNMLRNLNPPDLGIFM